MSIRLINVVGARPNFMKIAPLMDQFAAMPEIDPLLVHTGQHYDERMSDLFFRQLQIPEPDINLGVGSGTHTEQTAQIMVAFEKVLAEHKPDAVLVVGDVNSTIACGLVAVKMGIRLIHVEAGLRSFDRTMPEEINRILTDSISDLLFCTEESGVENLRREGVNGDRVHLVGNLMIDTLLKHKARADQSNILEQLELSSGGYAVLTLHRPSNVDDPAALSRILDAVEVIQRDIPVIFPVHPRTRRNIEKMGFGERVAAMKNLRLAEPMGYLEFLKLTSCATVILTDSGGIQEESIIVGVPCLTLRFNTERPVTVACGGSRLVGNDTQRILSAYREVCGGGAKAGELPPLWDGNAGQRIANILVEALSTEPLMRV